MIKTKQEILNHFSNINIMYNNPFEYQTLSNMIDELLEQEPKAEWIPVRERLPVAQKDGDKDFSDWLQITINLGKDNDVVSEAYYCFSKDRWYTDRFIVGEVIAWMPLPQPYKAESEEEECQEQK